jgi:hypothetical protein
MRVFSISMTTNSGAKKALYRKYYRYTLSNNTPFFGVGGCWIGGFGCDCCGCRGGLLAGNQAHHLFLLLSVTIGLTTAAVIISDIS